MTSKFWIFFGLGILPLATLLVFSPPSKAETNNYGQHYTLIDNRCSVAQFDGGAIQTICVSDGHLEITRSFPVVVPRGSRGAITSGSKPKFTPFPSDEPAMAPKPLNRNGFR